MKIFSVISFCTISLLSYSQQSNSPDKNKNPFSLYFGIENRYYIKDSLLQNPFIKSSEAEVYDIRKNDTIKIKTLVLPEKSIPDPTFSIAGKR